MKAFVEKNTWISLAAMACILYLPFLGQVHLFEWDEVNFAECAREMLVTKNYTHVQMDFKPFWEKPPLFFWLQSFCMNFFGVNEMSARLPNAILGIIQTVVIYFIGKNEVNKKFGIYWALILMAMPLPHLYFKSGIIDPWFNFFIFLSIYWLHKSTSNAKCAWWSGLFLGLAIITKGPVALLIVCSSALCLIVLKKYGGQIIFQSAYRIAIVVALITGLWLYPSMAENGMVGVQKFIQIQLDLLTQNVAGHQQPFYYHFVVLLLGCFPISILLWNRKLYKDECSLIEKWVLVYGLISFIIFSIVKTKIVHYSSLCYIPIAFYGAKYFQLYFAHKIGLQKIQKFLFLIISTLFVVLFICAPFAFNYVQNHLHLVADIFARANIAGSSKWPIYLSIIGLVLFMFYYLFWQACYNKNFKYSFLSLLVGIMYIQLSIYGYIGRAEEISQNAQIEFIKKYTKIGCVQTLHHSYGRYFYGAIQEPILYQQSVLDAQSQVFNIPLFTIIRNSNEEDFLENNLNKVTKVDEQSGYIVYRWNSKE